MRNPAEKPSLASPLAVAAAVCMAALFSPAPASGQDREVPYWATIRSDRLNMRVGPSREYPVEWVYSRPGLPIKVVRVVEGWRMIEDPDGEQGWVVARLLDPARGAIVTDDGVAPMRNAPSDAAALKWNLEPGVVGTLGACEDGWCLLDVEGHRGYVRQTRLWGAGEP